VSKSDDISTLFLGGGPPSASWHQGVVDSWDELSGANRVMISEEPFDDLRVLSTGALTPFQPGDVVEVVKVGTTAFILGKVRSVGAGLGERIASDKNVDGPDIPLNTDYADLPSSFGPQVSIVVGSGRRVLVIHSCAVSIPGGSSESYRGSAFQGVQISGATNILPSEAVYDCFFQGPPNSFQSLTSTTLLTAADGLNQGLNTFTCKYMGYVSGDIGSVSAYNRVLTVIPV
jgi:hypothetical protein